LISGILYPERLENDDGKKNFRFNRFIKRFRFPRIDGSQCATRVSTQGNIPFGQVKLKKKLQYVKEFGFLLAGQSSLCWFIPGLIRGSVAPEGGATR
jgi:hypothetical protein